MDLLTYLTVPTTSFGALAWAFFIAQIAVALGGVYLAFLRSDSHPIRRQALRRLGYAMLAAGALGTLFGALRLAALEPFTARYWFYGLAVVELGLAAYALFYARTNYPAQVAEFERASRGRGSQRGARPQPALHVNGSSKAGGTTLAETPPMASSTRRDARRDRKRRSR